jgi:predicted ATPase
MGKKETEEFVERVRVNAERLSPDLASMTRAEVVDLLSAAGSNVSGLRRRLNECAKNLALAQQQKGKTLPAYLREVIAVTCSPDAPPGNLETVLNKPVVASTSWSRGEPKQAAEPVFRIQLFGRLRIWRELDEIHLPEAQRKLIAFLSCHYNAPVEHVEAHEALGIHIKAVLNDLRGSLQQQAKDKVPTEEQLFPLRTEKISVNLNVAHIDLVAFHQHLESPTESVKNFLQAAKLYQEPVLSSGCGETATDEWLQEFREDVDARFWMKYAKFEDAKDNDDASLAKLATNLRARALIKPFVRAVLSELIVPQGEAEDKPFAELSFRKFLEALAAAGKFQLINEAGECLKSATHHAQREVPVVIARVLERLAEAEKLAKARAGETFGTEIEIDELEDRNEEVEELIDRVADYSLTTVIGPAGMGKTSLAKLAANRLRSEFMHGVCFVHLEDTVSEPRDKNAIAVKIGSALKWSLEKDAFLNLLKRLYDYRLLLILDGCETVLDGCAEVVSAILATYPKRIRVLATSRGKLPLPIGNSWQLPTLRLPEQVRMEWSHFVKFPAVRLFLKFADRSPRIPRNANTMAIITKLIGLVQGVPAGIRLEAARWPEMSLQEICDDLKRNRLGQGLENWLRSRLERSYLALDRRDQSVYQRLGVFVGEFTSEAVTAVCAGEALRSDINSSLDRLVASSLLDRRSSTGRYSVLNLYRRYALEKLEESGNAEKARRKHALYYAKLAQQLGHGVFGPNISSMLDRGASQEDDISEGLRWLLKNAPRDGLRAVLSIWPFWVVKGRIREGSDWLFQMRSAVNRISDAEKAVWSTAVGVLAYYESRYPDAISHCSQGAKLASKVRDFRIAAMALAAAGVARLFTNDPKGALRDFDRSKHFADQLGNPWLVALVNGNLALVQATLLGLKQQVANISKSKIVELAQDAREQAEKTQNEWLISLNWVNEAKVVEALQGEAARSFVETNLKNSLKLRYRLGDRYGMIQNLALLASSASVLDSPDQFRRAAILSGGVDTLRGNPDPIPVPFLNQEQYSRALEATKRALTTKFQKHYTIGANITLSRLISFALGDETSIRIHSGTAEETEGPLSELP